MTSKDKLETKGRAVMIVEDHDNMRKSLDTLLRTASKMEVQGCYDSAEEALIALEKGSLPDLMVVDLSLPEMSGLDLIRKVKKSWPTIRCLVLSGQADPRYRQQSLKAGATGFVLKGDPQEILTALENLLRD